jgi:hypothetical protein
MGARRERLIMGGCWTQHSPTPHCIALLVLGPTFVMNFILGGTKGYSEGTITSIRNVPPLECVVVVVVVVTMCATCDSERRRGRVGGLLAADSHRTHVLLSENRGDSCYVQQ